MPHQLAFRLLHEYDPTQSGIDVEVVLQVAGASQRIAAKPASALLQSWIPEPHFVFFSVNTAKPWALRLKAGNQNGLAPQQVPFWFTGIR